jgi:hypothetical protein
MGERQDRAMVRRADALADRFCDAVLAMRAAGLEVYVTFEGAESDCKQFGVWLTVKRDISPPDPPEEPERIEDEGDAT